MEHFTFILDFILLQIEPGLFLFVFFVAGLVAYAGYKQRMEKADQSIQTELKLASIEKRMGVAKRFLEKHFIYYQLLSPEGKLKFLARMRVIMASKRIVGQDGLKITREMQILTCAAFVQVTFGLKNFKLPRFKTIGLYPDVYKDRRLKRMYKGSTRPVGLIRFSWKHLKHGYMIPDDSINLALHELAHALKITIERKDVKLDESISRELFSFVEASSPLRSAILSGKVDSLRKYAAVNSDELFACCVEYFFENPADFKENLPSVYDKMCRILNQDMLNIEQDFYFKKQDKTFDDFKGASDYNRLVNKALNNHVEDGSFGWISTVMLLGIFLGPMLLYFSLNTVESDSTYVGMLLISILILGLVVFWRKFYASGYMSTFVFVAFMCFGWLLPMSVATIGVNSLVPVSHIEIIERAPNVINSGGEMLLINSKSKVAALREGVEIDSDSFRLLRALEGQYRVKCKMYYGVFGLLAFDSLEILLEDGHTLSL